MEDHNVSSQTSLEEYPYLDGRTPHSKLEVVGELRGSALQHVNGLRFDGYACD